MDEIFRGNVDWGEIVRQAGRAGWVFAPCALTRQFCHDLKGECEQLKLRSFTKPYKQVSQEFETFNISGDLSSLPVVEELAVQLGALVREQSGRFPALSWYQPNDVAVQRYSTVTSGIDAHRDFANDVLLVVSFTLQGSAKIGMHAKRDDPAPTVELETRPGSMLVLAAPLLYSDGRECRPTHSVGPPIVGPRTSLTLRHNMCFPRVVSKIYANSGSADY